MYVGISVIVILLAGQALIHFQIKKIKLCLSLSLLVSMREEPPLDVIREPTADVCDYVSTTQLA